MILYILWAEKMVFAYGGDEDKEINRYPYPEKVAMTNEGCGWHVGWLKFKVDESI